MTLHPTIFDDESGVLADMRPVNVRRTDPPTSQQAAESMTPAALSKQRGDVLTALAHIERHDRRGGTAYDVQRRLSFTGCAPQQSVIARRLSDLRDLRLIVDSGETRPGSSNRQLTVWCLTDEGRAAVPGAAT